MVQVKGKYELLQRYLVNAELDEVKLSYEQMERILGEGLPHSAYEYRPWWANLKKGGSQSNAWLNAGYNVKTVELGHYVIFAKADTFSVPKPVAGEVKSVTANTEQDYVEKIAHKLLQARSFLNSADLEHYTNNGVKERFEALQALRRLLGNIDNDMSFLGCLLIKEYLQSKHFLPHLNMALKPQGSPGLDVDEMTADGKRVIGELKTTYPYKENDLGAQQKNTFMKDFEKLQKHEADYKYFFVTEEKTYDIVCSKYMQYLDGVEVVLLK